MITEGTTAVASVDRTWYFQHQTGHNVKCNLFLWGIKIVCWSTNIAGIDYTVYEVFILGWEYFFKIHKAKMACQIKARILLELILILHERVIQLFLTNKF